MSVFLPLFPMPQYVLGIETATDVCSVALLKDESLVQEAALAQPRAHSTHLVPLIQETLQTAGLSPSDLNLIAVSQGPGSYTGLRIGLSTAKGLAYALDIPIIGVSTLEALALASTPHASANNLILVAFDARRDELFAAGFHYTPNAPIVLAPVLPVQNLTLSEVHTFLSAHLPSHVVAVGNGINKILEGLEADKAKTWLVLDGETCPPTAHTVAEIGWACYRAGNQDDVAAFEPSYMKAFFAKKAASVFDRLPPMPS